LAYASVDGPTQTSTIAGDLRARYHPGTRLKYNQNQAIQNYWSFDTNSADSKGSATMANIGTPTYTAGKFSNALTLNGTNQALSITDAAAFKPAGEFTFGAWIKTSTTGTSKWIFQSYSDNTDARGFRFRVSTTNALEFRVGATTADDESTLAGTTVVTDGNWHYAVVSYRPTSIAGGTTQVYLDGKLEISGYTAQPAYAATNYVRIGCGNSTGTNVEFFNGQIDDLFIAAYALDEQTIAAKYAAATAQGTGDLTLTKYALVTASSYSAPTTTVTIYSGTDHTMMNATVSNAYYSTQKAPYGFPLGQEKWSVDVTFSGANMTATTTANNWVNPGSKTISVPIGKWNVLWGGAVSQANSASEIFSARAALSTSANSVSDNDLVGGALMRAAAISAQLANITKNKDVSLSVKTVYYLIATIAQGGGTITVGFDVSALAGAFIVRATSTLL
jgi:hypothetical protein